MLDWMAVSVLCDFSFALYSSSRTSKTRVERFVINKAATLTRVCGIGLLRHRWRIDRTFILMFGLDYFVCSMYIVERKIATMQTNADILNATGRQYGPDFILKVDTNIKSPGDPAADGTIADIGRLINNKSTISELLNIVAICCNADAMRNNNTLEEGSLPTDRFGLCDITAGNVGKYNTAAPAPAGAAAVNAGYQATSLYANCTTPIFDIDTLLSVQTAVSTGPATYKIHQGLIRRKTSELTTAGTYDLNEPIDLGDLAGVAPHNPIIGLMSRVFKQSINILEHTRKILGPKGWTALFASIKGGGGLKKTQKIQHRRHRRRYSSKQY